MKYNLYCISKADSQELVEDFVMKCRGFGAQLLIHDIFSNAIAKAQKISADKAKESYSQAFMPFIKNTPSHLCIALHPNAKMLDSHQFANLIANHQEVNFFIAGAYGFEEGFLRSLKTLSLTPLTLSHKIAKIVLCEQIYRALSIMAKHPYHK
ncbi:23S rRNA (pseudouridine(1915)-N(3))-methyltransferase RlmH [uncultured Helicobacter sp.]|uniref:23S rRNA (pseudouridine(1915)-N(3))-methyltransferase RlmH n=1 Tax=uncultured Helicobacter sp. TaxID=175537 RepID=UPI001C395F44|nr:23S rRNA (pseudouridine(1915)-N(3))-methyltransferase RlmH [Candidatus Helicobacter avicola]